MLESTTNPAQLSLSEDTMEDVKDGSECEEVNGKEAQLANEELVEKAKSNGNVRLVPTWNSCSDSSNFSLVASTTCTSAMAWQ